MESAQVSFQWKNVDFRLKNVDLLIRNPDFVLKNVEFMIKKQFPAWCPSCRADANDAGSDAAGSGPGRIPPEALSFLEQRGVISNEFLFRFLQQNEQEDTEERTFACPSGCGR